MLSTAELPVIDRAGVGIHHNYIVAVRAPYEGWRAWEGAANLQDAERIKTQRKAGGHGAFEEVAVFSGEDVRWSAHFYDGPRPGDPGYNPKTDDPSYDAREWEDDDE